MTVSWFSAGVSSAVATKLAIDCIDRIIYTHIEDQHPDTLRFVKDCEAWFGKPVTILQSPYKNVENVVRAMQYVNGIRGAQCTNILKRRVRKEWEIENTWFQNFDYVWGMDAEETKPRPPKNISRVDALIKAMPESKHIFPLVDHKLSKQDAHAILKRAGIKRPAMYDLGYHNNNCVGCLKASAGYWNRIRVDFPAVFASRAALEREIGASCINGTFLDELDPEAGRDLVEIEEECGVMCETALAGKDGGK